jgi:hypothetical protein
LGDHGNSWTTLDKGGWEGYAMEAITGASAFTWYYAHNNSWTMNAYDSSFNKTSSTPGNSNASVLAALASDLSQGDDVVLAHVSLLRAGCDG